MKNPKTIVIAFVLLLLVILAVFRSRTSSGNLNVEPHAREEIERAKQR